MARQLPPECLRLLKRQHGIIASWQARSAGLTPDRIEALVRVGRWQRVGRGVYAAFTGRLPREAFLWAAVLRAGQQAVLSHETAAGLYGILNDPGRTIHVTVPREQHIRPLAGLVVHRSSRFLETADPGFRPPRTRLEETVFDLTDTAASFDDVVALLARSCQRRATTPFLLTMALDRRPRVRWRKEICLALQDVDAGANSVLELRYLRDVERAHGLPASERQAPGLQYGQQVFRDVRYHKYRVLVELDGQASHPDERRWKDKYRDNAATVDGYASSGTAGRTLTNAPARRRPKWPLCSVNVAGTAPCADAAPPAGCLFMIWSRNP
jgi:putative AbiEi antitoxin of type IV toxin-antitoxin system